MTKASGRSRHQVPSSQVPPQNIEAEESVLGAMLVAESTLTQVIDEVKLDGEDFYLDKHAAIFRCVHDLYSASKPVDELSVTDALQQSGEIEKAGGKHYLSELAAKVPAPGRAKHYASIVQRDARSRGVIEKAQMAIEAARGGSVNGEVADLADGLHALMSCAGGQMRVRPADVSRVRPIRWLWDKRLPLGYLSLLLGAEGIGKGTVAAWLIARLSKGELSGDLAGEAGRVLVIGDEDAFDSVWVPRLYAAGADLDLVDTLDDEGEPFDLRDEQRLRELVAGKGYRLLFFDALVDTLGADVDDWRSKEVRDRLRPLRHLARDLDVCALGSLHPNKGQRTSFRDLISGSHAFNASARSSLLVAAHPYDEDRRVLVRGKGNLSAAPRSFEFAIAGRELELNGHGFSLPILADEGEGELTVEDVIKPQRDGSERGSVADEIHALGTGQVQSRSEIAKVLGRRADDRTVGRALEQLETQGKWEKVGRGKWRALVIGPSSEGPMSRLPGIDESPGAGGAQ
jgi:hypothetical protein